MSGREAEGDRAADAGRYPPIQLSSPRVLLPLLLWGVLVVLLWTVAAGEAPLLGVGVTVVLAVLAVGDVARADLAVGESRLSPTAQRLLALPLVAGAAVIAISAEGGAKVSLPVVALVFVMPVVLPAVLPRRVRERVLRVATWDPDKDYEPTGPTVQTWQQR